MLSLYLARQHFLASRIDLSRYELFHGRLKHTPENFGHFLPRLAFLELLCEVRPEEKMTMNKKLSLFLLSASALCVGLLLGSQLVEQGAKAQRTNAAPPEGAWEYCAAQVTEVYARGDKKTVGIGSVCYLKSSGAKCERFETTVEGTLAASAATARADSVARITSKLGDEGWQMVGEGPWIVINTEDKPLYFRRPKVD